MLASDIDNSNPLRLFFGTNRGHWRGAPTPPQGSRRTHQYSLGSIASCFCHFMLTCDIPMTHHNDVGPNRKHKDDMHHHATTSPAATIPSAQHHHHHHHHQYHAATAAADTLEFQTNVQPHQHEHSHHHHRHRRHQHHGNEPPPSPLHDAGSFSSSQSSFSSPTTSAQYPLYFLSQDAHVLQTYLAAENEYSKRLTDYVKKQFFDGFGSSTYVNSRTLVCGVPTA